MNSHVMNQFIGSDGGNNQVFTHETLLLGAWEEWELEIFPHSFKDKPENNGKKKPTTPRKTLPMDGPTAMDSIRTTAGISLTFRIRWVDCGGFFAEGMTVVHHPMNHRFKWWVFVSRDTVVVSVTWHITHLHELDRLHLESLRRIFFF